MESIMQHAASSPLQLSFPLPNSPSSKIHLSLTRLDHAILLFLTSGHVSSGTCPLGSFIYAIPNLKDSSAVPSSTPLYSDLNTVDFATRLATIIAKRTKTPTYVGSSISIASAGRGGDVNEEMDSFKKILNVSLAAIDKETKNKS